MSLAQLMGAQAALERGDRLGAARQAMAALLLEPASADAGFLLGLAWHPGWLFRALWLAPDHFGAAVNLAMVLDGLGRRSEALRILRRSVARLPALPPTLVNLALMSLPPAASPWLQRAAAVAPGDAIVRLNLASILGRLGQPGAMAEHRRTLVLAPGLAAAVVNLALASRAATRLDAAARWHRRGLAADPFNADALAGLGAVARAEDRNGLSWDRRALAIRPDHAPTLANVSHGLFFLGEAPLALRWAERAEAADPADPEFGRGAIGLTNFVSWPEPMAVLARHRRWARRHAVPGPRPPRRQAEGRPLRIGYLSVSLRRHPVGYFLLPLLEHHDRGAFEIVGYDAGAGADEITARLRAATTAWREVRRLDDAALAEAVRADRIDILVDLDGHAGGNRLTVFARRPAPVQVTWLDYPGSTGTDCFDAALVDPFEVPEGAERFYSEPVIRLAGGRLAYRPPEASPGVGEPSGDGVMLGCFNNPAKIGAGALALWARAMSALPETRLTLKGKSYGDAAIRERYLGIFAAAGVDPRRLAFSGWSPHAEMLRELSQLDIVLDPMPHSGYLTSCEALWMGVPIVTRAGERAVERQTGGLLTRIGLPELIASTPEDYMAILDGLVRDPARRLSLRRSMRARLKASSLMDEAGFARTVETAYRRLWAA
jgi:predicted O-linked N-acetylglucosamine transferase (SPINDLY family)